MSVGIVIVTHGRTGSALVEEAEFILGEKLDSVQFVAFNQSSGQAESVVAIHGAIERANEGDGVLILTDLIGSSPSNRASLFLPHFDAVLVTGINLSMFLSVWSNRSKPLGALARKAVESGRRGIKIIQE